MSGQADEFLSRVDQYKKMAIRQFGNVMVDGVGFPGDSRRGKPLVKLIYRKFVNGSTSEIYFANHSSWSGGAPEKHH